MRHHSIDFSGLFRASPHACAVLAPDYTVLEVNAAYLDLLGRSHGQVVGRRILENLPVALALAADDTYARYQVALNTAIREGQRAHDILPVPLAGVEPDAQNATTWWHVVNVPLLDDVGSVVCIAQHVLTVAQQPALPEGGGAWSEEINRMRRLFEHAPLMVALLRGRRHVCEFLNAAGRELFGQRNVVGLPLVEAIPELRNHSDLYILDRARVSGVPERGKHVSLLLQRAGAAPEERYLDLVIQPILNAEGQVSAMLLMGHDVTKHHQDRENLTRYRDRLEDLVEQRTEALRVSESERQRAQEALLQSRKMEAVGKLTGEVAHDFNNVLQIIGDNLQLLAQEHLSPAGSRRLRVAGAALARGRKLTEQLLTFARKRTLAPAAVDLAELLESMRELLLHAVGDKIQLDVKLAPGLWHCLADPHHLGNVLLNLVINAKDAIDGVGVVTISAQNHTLTPTDINVAAGDLGDAGPYVGIVVADTGCGMSAATREQAFEPFFTTKGAGRGTGLGLSMAYGFISQSRGGIRIDSELGKGTAITLYLPYAETGAELTPALTQAASTAATAENGGPILVVDPDADMSASAVDMLTALGYRALVAADAQTALEKLREDASIQLIFTEAVLPGGVNSVELARRAIAMSPDIEILYTAGLAATHPDYPRDLRDEALPKPHDQEVLARRIRHALRNREQRLLLRRSTESHTRVESADESLRILLVEDQDDTRDTCADLLSSLGHKVKTEARGEDAIKRLKQARYDVLCTDIGLPGISGVELAQRARKLDPEMAIVFATGYGAPDSTVVAELQAYVMIKPYSMSLIQRTLGAIQQRRKNSNAF